MKILIAPDSFKDSLSAVEVAEAMKRGVLSVLQRAQVKTQPMADGGEGSLQTLVDATQGRIVEAKVHDPLMRKITSRFGVLGDGKTAIVEVAAASGLELLKPEERNPMVTTSYGTGELILKAMDAGCREFVVALGGSAMNDGGAGMMQALGAKLLDSNGKNVKVGGGVLKDLHSIDVSMIDSRLKDCSFSLACDVDNPLLGKNGASYIYGPQKGGTPEMILQLDQGLKNYSDVVLKLRDVNVNVAGAGAAGGIAASFIGFFNVKIQSGFSLVAELVSLEKEIKNSDLVITGEGKVDHQTLSGKVPFGVGKLAMKYDKPVWVFTGAIGEGADVLLQHGVAEIFPLSDHPVSQKFSMDNAAMLLTKSTAKALWNYLQSNNNGSGN